MAEHPRIEELRRRVHKDKASIAFAQLAEEYRRAGRFEEAIDTCRTGLSHHPGYLSAHVTLGRALIEVGELQQAHEELKRVLAAAPENLAALKGLADIHYRRGEAREALAHYRRALEFAPHDPDLEHLVAQIARQIEPDQAPGQVPGGLSFEEAMGEFLALGGRAETPGAGAPDAIVDDTATSIDVTPVAVDQPDPLPVLEAATPDALAVPIQDLPVRVEAVLVEDVAVPIENLAVPAGDVAVPVEGLDAPVVHLDVREAAFVPVPPPAETVPAMTAPDAPPAPRAAMQVEALEQWLDAILADRQNRR